MPYGILIHEPALQELERLRVYDVKRIMDAIEEQSLHQPTVPTRNRKVLKSLKPSFEHVGPVWELRVGEFRVFYDVEKAFSVVHVRAVRRKSARQRTEDIV